MNPFFNFTENSGIITGNLDTLGSSFVPEKLPHREKEIEHMVRILASIMRKQRPSNLILYGKTGTGKTSAAHHVTKLLSEATGPSTKVIYCNCQIYDSPYSILVNIVNTIKGDTEEQIPSLGWPLDRIYLELMGLLSREGGALVIILDELDKLILKNGGDSLYVILKIIDDSVRTITSIIGITNDAHFIETLEPRIKSRLNQESVVFAPYNADQLRDIISYRLKGVVKEESVEPSAISLCSAIGAQEHGDARKALDLMRIAIEIAVREKREKLTDREIYEARDKFDMNVVREAITTLPLHSKMVLLSTIISQETSNGQITTGEIQENYRNMAVELGISPLSIRRISDILSELQDYGLLTSITKSLGRYGRTRFFRTNGEISHYRKYLLEDEVLSSFKGSRMVRQARFDSIDQDEAEKFLGNIRDSKPADD
jgi:cell division control protein 6